MVAWVWLRFHLFIRTPNKKMKGLKLQVPYLSSRFRAGCWWWRAGWHLWSVVNRTVRLQWRWYKGWDCLGTLGCGGGLEALEEQGHAARRDSLLDSPFLPAVALSLLQRRVTENCIKKCSVGSSQSLCDLTLWNPSDSNKPPVSPPLVLFG